MVIFIKTRLFFVTLLLLVLISMAGASAADDQIDDIVANGENVEVVQSDSIFEDDISDDLTSQNEESDNSINDDLSEANDENLKEDDLTDLNPLVGDFSELDKLIRNAKGELKLEKDYIYNPSTDSRFAPDGINIEKHELVIDGQDHIIDGRGQTALLSCVEYQAQITLQNIKFINGKGNENIEHSFLFGAVNFFGTNKPNVLNCTFINNSGIAAGAFSFGVGAYFENCTFINNRARETGGAITGLLNVETIIVNSRFINNTAYQGGAIHSMTMVAVLYCIFENNTAHDGGAIHGGSITYVNSSLFSNNYAAYGGAIHTIYELQVENSYFLFNNAIDNSPNVYINRSLGDARISLDENNYMSLRPYDFSRLQEEINDCTGNVLTLTNDYYCTEADSQAFPDGVKINRPLIIEGQGHMIYAANRTRIFDAIADGVIFKNITFAGGFAADEGGAIHFSNTGTVENCTFLSNYAGLGGAVSFDKLGTVSNSIFANNTATANGGAIYFKENGTVMTSGFVENSAKDNGGAIYFNMDGTVTGAVFANNVALNGGAIYSNGLCDIQITNFTFNQADEGGALFLNSGGSVLYSQFLLNQANSFGGAISTSGDLSVKLSEFTYNIAPDASFNIKLRNGAELTSAGTIPETLIPKSFHDLEVAIDECDGFLNLTDDYMFNPDTDNFDGFNITKDNLVIDGQGHILFGGNKARLFTVNASNVILRNMIFMNFLADGSNGINIVDFLENGTVENCTFLNNTASKTVLSLTDGLIIGSNFVNNTANRGAIDLNKGTIDSCIFSENRGSYGGAIYMNQYGVVKNSTFLSNNATDYGGAIYIYTNALISNCTFVTNYGRNGGAIYSNNDVSVELSNFVSNEALFCAAVRALENIYVSESNFLMNNAGFYGAIEFTRGTVENSNFTLNEGMDGGAIFSYFDAIIVNSTFNMNNALNTYGGAIEINNACAIMGCTFNLNTGETGGAVYVGQSGAIYDCVFNMNEGERGSAIYCSFRPTLISNCTFNNNTATNGTVYYNTPGFIDNCTFNINQAENGGGLFIKEDMGIGNCNFNGNQAKNGSAIYFAKEGQVTDSDF